MDLLSPISLIWFIPLAAAIIVLYLLKLKRREHLVSSVLLWRDAVADIQANAPFQKLKKNLLLFLQLLALLLLVAAIARPFTRTVGVSENKIVVIIDNSASMQATDVSPSRLEQAKRRAIDVIKRMGPGDTMLVMTAGAKARVVASFASDKKALTAAVSGLKPTDAPCNMRQAMVLALSLVAGKSQAAPRIVLFSDGLFGPLADLAAGNAKLDFVRIGERCDNVAITGMDSRRTLAGQQQVFVSLHSFSTRERDFNLEIYLNDQLLDIREETLPPGNAKQEILSNLTNAAGRVTAQLDIADDLAADNSATIYLTGRRKLSILMVSKGNIFLENALNLDPRTRLVRTDALPADFEKQKYDLAVFDGIEPPKSLPQGGYLLINTFADQGPAETAQAVNRPSVIDSARNHPVGAYVDFTNVRIAEAKYLKLKPWASTIIEGEAGALGVAGAKDGRGFVQLSFSLLESDFPLHVGFPIFVANCLDWLVPAASGSAGDSIRTGQAAYIDVPPQTAKLTVTGPDGREHSVKVNSIPVVFDDTERAGLYTVSGEGVTKEFAVNICSSAESNVKPRESIHVGARSFASAGGQVRTNREFYGVLILVALAILAFEWYAYHRRL